MSVENEDSDMKTNLESNHQARYGSSHPRGHGAKESIPNYFHILFMDCGTSNCRKFAIYSADFFSLSCSLSAHEIPPLTT